MYSICNCAIISRAIRTKTSYMESKERTEVSFTGEKIKKAVEVFSRYDHIIEIILFGSQATGKAREDSDIDLLLVERSISSGLSIDEWFFVNKSMSDDIKEAGLTVGRGVGELHIKWITRFRWLHSPDRVVKEARAQGEILLRRS